MADGSIRIDVGLNTAKAEKDLAKLKDKIGKLEKQIGEDTSRKNALAEQIGQAGAEADKAKEKVRELKKLVRETRGSQKDQYREELADAVDEQRASQGRYNSLDSEYNSVSKRIETNAEKLNAMKEEAGEVQQKLDEAAESGENLGEAVETAKGKLSRMLKTVIGFVAAANIFKKLASYTKEAIKAFAEHDDATKASIKGIKDALDQLKISWGAAFAPILEAVAPLLQKLIGWLTDAANAVARFFATLSGKTTYKKAVARNTNLAESYDNIGESVKAAEKQIMGFDEINKLNDTTSSGAGGAGGNAGGLAPYDFVEEEINQDGLAARLAFAVKDVFFDWSDLTAEQIAEKALAGFLGLGGALIGGMIGGVPGAIIGLAAGLALGTLLDATIFNFDGELSPAELGKALIDAAGFTAGAIIGFTVTGGNPLGAALGAAIGLKLAFDLGQTLFTPEGKLNPNAFRDLLKKIFDFNPAIVLNPGLFSLTIYQKLSMLFNELDFHPLEDFKKKLKEYFEPFIEKWKQSGSEEANSVGFNIVMGILDGIISGVKDILVKIYDAMIKPIVDEVKRLLGIESPSRVFAEIGGYIIDGLWQGIETKWNDFIGFFEGLWNGLKNWWNGLSLSPFHIPRPVIEWGAREISGGLAGVLNFFGLPAALPTLSISWMARGGIVDAPTLIGAGENGKEAIVPLENNTEWISVVAEGLMAKLAQGKFTDQLANAIAAVPIPRLAGGSVAPPNAISSGYGASTLLAEIKALRDEISALARQPIEVKSSIYMDKRKVGESVSEYQRGQQRAGG